MRAAVAAESQLLTGRATTFQSLCESAFTLHAMGERGELLMQIASRLAQSEGELSTELGMCHDRLANAIGLPLRMPLDTVLRASGGGARAQPGHETVSVWDSAWLLGAADNRLSVAQRGNLVNTLASAQDTDGSFTIGNASSVYLSALATHALNNAASAGNAVAVTAAHRGRGWLMNQPIAAGLLSSDLSSSAMSVIALETHADRPVAFLDQLRNGLLAQQLADGSWEGDVFTTALVLRALSHSPNTTTGPPPGSASIAANVVDSVSNQPISQARVRLQDSAGRESVQLTDSQGRVAFAMLASGRYSLEVSMSGYTSIQSSVMVADAQSMTLGGIALVSSTGSTNPPGGGSDSSANGSPNLLVSGIVRERPSNNPIAGALVVIEPMMTRVTTDSEGRFVIPRDRFGGEVISGGLVITASKRGYGSGLLHATVSATAPLLVEIGLTPIPATATSLRTVSGTVVSQRDGAPVAGARLMLYSQGNQPLVTYSDLSGAYSILGVPPESVVLQVNATGFAHVSRMLPLGLLNTDSESVRIQLASNNDAEPTPDLHVASVEKRGTVTDPVTLAVSGEVDVEVGNWGRLATSNATRVIVFEDRNRNRKFDPASDNLLGTSPIGAGWAPGESRKLTIPIAGVLLFRDNQLSVEVDPDESIDESDRSNNFASCLCVTEKPYVEDFNDGIADGALEIHNHASQFTKWTVISGEYVPGTEGGAVLFGDPQWENYDAQVRFIYPNAAQNDIGLIFRAKSESDWYQVRVKAGEARFMRFHNGEISTLASTASIPPILANQWHELKVKVTGRTVRAFLDDIQILQLDSLNTGSGKVGLHQDGGVEVRYDDLKVTPGLMLSEDFSTPPSVFKNAAYYRSAPHSIVNGELVRADYGSSSAGEPEWADYTVEMDIRFPQGSTNDAGFLVLARDAQPSDSEVPSSGPYTHATIRGSQFRLVASNVGLIAEVPIPPYTNPNGAYRMRAEVSGSRVRWFIDDVFMYDYPNVGWRTGAIGLIQDGVSAAYDNVKVWRTGLAGADLTASALSAARTAAGNWRIQLRVGNGGQRSVAPGVKIEFRQPGTLGQNTLVGTATTGQWLDGGAFEDVTVELPGDALVAGTLTVFVDAKHDAFECDETNNTASTTVSWPQGDLSLNLATDRSEYQHDETLVWRAVLSRPSDQALGTGLLDVSITDAAGTSVERLGPFSFSELRSGHSVDISRPWSIGKLLAQSGYRLVATATMDGLPTALSRATVFSVVTGTVKNNESSVRTDRQSYGVNQPVTVTSTVLNTSPNLLQERLVASTVVQSSDTAAFATNESIVQLSAGSQRQFSYVLPAGRLSAGNYRVQLELKDSAGNVLTQSNSSFVVQDSQVTLAGLHGIVTVAPSQVQIGSQAVIRFDAEYSGDVVLTNAVQQLVLLNPSDGVVVDSVSQNVQAWQPGQTQTLSWNWTAVGSGGQDLVVVGHVKTSHSQRNLGQASVRLKNSPDIPQPGFGVSGQLAINPTPVLVGQPAHIHLTLANAGDVPLNNATVRLRVIDPGNANVVVASHTQTPVNLPSRGSLNIDWSWLATGQGGASLVVSATLEPNGGGEVPLASSPFTLLAPTFQPLSGTLDANPAAVAAGDAVDLVVMATNPNGQAINANLRLSVAQEQGTSLVPVTEWIFTPSIGANGGTFAGNQSWTPSGGVGSGYLITWSTIGSGTAAATVLATARVTVTEPASKISLKPGELVWPHLLLLVSCNPNDDAGKAQSPACDEPKAQAVREYLGQLGVNAKVVTTRAEFETEMRCGNFNVYAVSGGSDKLSDALIKELRASVSTGAGLWIDGTQSPKDKPLHELIGVRWDGTLQAEAPIVSLSGLFNPGNLQTLGKPVNYFAMNGTTVHASFGGQPNAVVAGESGVGRSLAFAFNLSTLMQQPANRRDPQLDDLVRRTLSHLGPHRDPSPVPGVANTFVSEVQNTGSVPTTVQLQATVPAALYVVTSQPLGQVIPASSGTGGPTTLRWTAILQPGQRVPVALQVLTYAAGDHSIAWLASAGSAEATYEHTLQVQHPSVLAQSAIHALDGWQPGGNAAQSVRTAARAAASAASTLMSESRYAESLLQWSEVAQALDPMIGEADIPLMRRKVAYALQSSQRGLCLQWACISGQLDFKVRNQSARNVPLQDNVVGSRFIHNHCPIQVKDIPVTSSWVNRRTGGEVQHLWDNLTLNPGDINRRDNGWQANGQIGDVIDITLTAKWPTEQNHLFLARDSLQLVVLPPILNGALDVQPTPARVGQNVTISRLIANSGALVQNMPVTIRITDPGAGGVLVQEITQTMTLNPGEANQGNTNWNVVGSPGKTFHIELRATVNGVVQTLANTTLVVIP